MSASSVAAWHEWIGWGLIALNAAAGVWALGAHWLAPLRRRALWVLVLVAQLSAFASAISGALLVNTGERTLTDFHALYGFSTVIAVAILYSYRRSDFIADRQYLLYGVGCLFIMGLGLRNLYL